MTDHMTYWTCSVVSVVFSVGLVLFYRARRFLRWSYTSILALVVFSISSTILSSSVKTKVVGRWWAMRLYCHLLGLGSPFGSSFWWYCLSWLLAFWCWWDMYSWWCSSCTWWTTSTPSLRCSPLMLSDRIAFLMIGNRPGTFLGEKRSSWQLKSEKMLTLFLYG